MYNFHSYYIDQTSTIAQTETMSSTVTVVGGAPSDSVSDDSQASKWLLTA